MQIDNSRFFIHKLDASCFNNLKKVCKYQVETSLIFINLLQLVDNLQQAGKIHNLQQVSVAILAV